MKKLSYLIALSVALMSCSQNEITKQDIGAQSNQIEFSPVIGKQSKAIEAKLADLEGGFKSLGYTTDGAFNNGTGLANYFDITIKKEGGSWVADNTVYWPAAKKLSIFSYLDCDAILNYNNPTFIASTLTYPTLVCSLKNIVAGQKDLIVSSNMDLEKNGSPVTIIFKHILSQVRFTAKTADDTYKVKVKSLSIYSSVGAEFTFNPTTNTVIGSWSNYGPKIETPYILGSPIECGNVATVIEENSTTSNCFMIIPQAKDAGLKLNITYDVYDGSGNLISENVTKSSEMEELVIGKKYIYNLTLPSAGAVPIKFDVSMSEWEDGTKIDVRYDSYSFTTLDELDSKVKGVLTSFNTDRATTSATSPTAIYSLELDGTISESRTIDISSIESANLTAADYIVLDFKGVTFTSGTLTINAGSNWTATQNTLSAQGAITLKKKI